MNLHIFITASLLTLLFSTAIASDDHHEHNSEHHHNHESKHHHDDELEFTEHHAHEHGHARATISYSNHNLILSITLPTIDVFGFEHKPHSEDEKSIAKKALDELSIINNIVSIDPSCKLDTLTSNYQTSSHDENHSDIEMNANLICDNNEPRLITFTLFETLPTLEQLTVEYISDNKQDLHTLTPIEKAITAN